MGRLDEQNGPPIKLPDLFLVTHLPPSTFNIKVADEDKAGGEHWGRREGQGTTR
jgi:hypothetical protein